MPSSCMDAMFRSEVEREPVMHYGEANYGFSPRLPTAHRHEKGTLQRFTPLCVAATFAVCAFLGATALQKANPSTRAHASSPPAARPVASTFHSRGRMPHLEVCVIWWVRCVQLCAMPKICAFLSETVAKM